jgi:hypothetical protein
MSTSAITQPSNWLNSLKRRWRVSQEIARMKKLRAAGFPGWDEPIAQLEQQLCGSPSVPAQETDNSTNSIPTGSYNFAGDQADRKRIEAGAIIQMQEVLMPVSLAGPIAGFQPFLCDANGMQIIARTMSNNGQVIESSDTARVFVRINSPNAMWLPLGYGVSPQSDAKSDAYIFQGYIYQFWAYVQTPTQDPQGQPYLVLALLRSASIIGAAGGSSLYVPPVSGPQEAVSTAPMGAESRGRPGVPSGPMPRNPQPAPAPSPSPILLPPRGGRLP